jgi:hypothetical protein
MRSVIYSMSVSLDGYIAGPDGSFDWTTTSVLPFGVAAMPFRLNPSTSVKSPVSGIVVAVAAVVPFGARAIR